MQWCAVVLALAAALHVARGGPSSSHELPDGFIVGAGTSSYQCEGAWNIDGKSEGFFDNLLHSPALSSRMTNADTAADSYHRFKEDVAAARALKLQMYRFSLSWERLLPTGRTDVVNPHGLRYYNALLDELHGSGIEPMITLNHFDFPTTLLTKDGGWQTDAMVDAFVDFAEFAFTNFGERVRYWTTHNEPYLFCTLMTPPEKSFTKDKVRPQNPLADYECIHRMVLAHGRVYRLYQEKFASKQRGLIGLSNFSFGPQPNSTSYADVAAARRYNLQTMGMTFGPLVTGQYPAEVRHFVAEASRLEGFNKSKLPEFSPQESAMLRGTIDFLGVNHYFGQLVAAGERPNPGSLMTDAGVQVLKNALNMGSVASFEQMTPWTLRETVRWLWDEYHLPIFVTENGLVTPNDVENPLDDKRRAIYHRAYILELLRAVYEDGVEVLGYLAWSLIDVFEWNSEYRRSYGLVHVDFAGGSLNRTLKQSSAFFVELATTRRVPDVALSSTAASPGELSSVILVLPLWLGIQLMQHAWR